MTSLCVSDGFQIVSQGGLARGHLISSLILSASRLSPNIYCMLWVGQVSVTGLLDGIVMYTGVCDVVAKCD